MAPQKIDDVGFDQLIVACACSGPLQHPRRQIHAQQFCREIAELKAAKAGATSEIGHSARLDCEVLDDESAQLRRRGVVQLLGEVFVVVAGVGVEQRPHVAGRCCGAGEAQPRQDDVALLAREAHEPPGENGAGHGDPDDPDVELTVPRQLRQEQDDLRAEREEQEQAQSSIRRRRTPVLREVGACRRRRA